MDDAVGGAVSVWCEGGGIGGSGASEIREGTASDIDIGEDEIAGRLCEGEGYGSCFARFESGDIRGECNFGPNGIDGEGDSVIGIGFILVVVSSSIGEFVVGDVNDAIGGAVGIWREGGGVNGAGYSSPVGERPACYGDVGFNEVGGSL